MATVSCAFCSGALPIATVGCLNASQDGAQHDDFHGRDRGGARAPAWRAPAATKAAKPSTDGDRDGRRSRSRRPRQAPAWYVTHRGLESTDDAQVDADVVSVPTRTSGVVAKVAFIENQAVKAGELLAELDAEPAKARLAQAEANLAAAEASAEAADADARVAETNARGNKSVAEASRSTGAQSSAVASTQQIAEGEAQVASADDQPGARQARPGPRSPAGEAGRARRRPSSIRRSAGVRRRGRRRSRQAQRAPRLAQGLDLAGGEQDPGGRTRGSRQSSDVDALIEQARSRARTAHAQVAVSKATRDLAALDLSYTRIVAPQDGLVSKKTIEVGQMVPPGRASCSSCPRASLWITGNFKETQISADARRPARARRASTPSPA